MRAVKPAQMTKRNGLNSHSCKWTGRIYENHNWNCPTKQISNQNYPDDNCSLLSANRFVRQERQLTVWWETNSVKEMVAHIKSFVGRSYHNRHHHDRCHQGGVRTVFKLLDSQSQVNKTFGHWFWWSSSWSSWSW